LPPAARAWDNPIAIACLRLVTFLPELLLNLPALRSCIAFATFSDALLPYFFAMSLSLISKINPSLLSAHATIRAISLQRKV